MTTSDTSKAAEMQRLVTLLSQAKPQQIAHLLGDLSGANPTDHSAGATR